MIASASSPAGYVRYSQVVVIDRAKLVFEQNLPSPGKLGYIKGRILVRKTLSREKGYQLFYFALRGPLKSRTFLRCPS